MGGAQQEDCIAACVVRCHAAAGGRLSPGGTRAQPVSTRLSPWNLEFKRTPLTLPPTDDDLPAHHVDARCSHTAMPSFRSLTPAAREALVQYVRYLSIRGFFERPVVASGNRWCRNYDDDERLLDPKQKEISPTVYSRQLEMLNAILVDVVQPWLDASKHITVVPPPPVDYDTPKSIARGRELFFTTLTNCGKCHGDTAVGDGQTEDYDEWTKEVEPTSPEALADYLALGALPPRHSQPRNIAAWRVVGGNRPEDFYVKSERHCRHSP